MAAARGLSASNRHLSQAGQVCLTVPVARLIAAASRLGAVMGDRLAELDFNPVLAGPDGAVAVDWLMVLEEGD